MTRRRFRTIAVTVAALSLMGGLTAPLTDAAQPSPRRMLVTSDNQVLSLSPDGTDPRTLAELPVISGADWGPGGRQVAYAGTRCLQVCAGPLIHRTELRVMDADGSHDRVLLTMPVSHIWTVDWSPDGTWIAFLAGHGYTCWGCPPPWALHLYNVRNRAHVVLGPAGDLDWSPDSRRIALTHAGGVHVVDVANGAVPTRVTATEIGAGSPSWSPDGRLIAFLRSGDAGLGHHRLWVMRPDGSESRSLHRVGWTEASWAPDSRSIATVNPTHDRIQVTAIDGSARHEIRPPSGALLDVTWSPRGTTIAYLLDPEWDEPTAVRAVRPDGTHDRAVHSAPWLQSPIRWSP